MFSAIRMTPCFLWQGNCGQPKFVRWRSQRLLGYCFTSFIFFIVMHQGGSDKGIWTDLCTMRSAKKSTYAKLTLLLYRLIFQSSQSESDLSLIIELGICTVMTNTGGYLLSYLLTSVYVISLCKLLVFFLFFFLLYTRTHTVSLFKCSLSFLLTNTMYQGMIICWKKKYTKTN